MENDPHTNEDPPPDEEGEDYEEDELLREGLWQEEEEDEEDEADEEDEEDEAAADDDELVMQEVMEELVQRGAQAMRQWCAAHAISPEPCLEEAFAVALMGVMQGPLMEQQGQDLVHSGPGGPLPPGTQSFTADLMARLPKQDQIKIAQALEQVGRFLSSFPSPQALFAALGLGGEE